VRAAVLRFALAGLIAVALVGLASFLLMRRIGTSEAIDNASELTNVVGGGIVEPNLTPGLMQGKPRAIARFDELIRAEVLGDPVVRVKLWTGAGRLVYSDEPRLIGQRYELGEDELATLRTGAADSEVSDLSKPENRFERDQGKLLEAYTRVRAPDGEALLFEAYQEFSSVTSGGRSLWLAFAPALIGALILLELIQVPLASSLARRVRDAHRDRERLLQRAVDSSDRERRRIAGDLHDGAVQDLAGLAFSLDGAARRLDDTDADSAEALREGAEKARGSVRSLRSLLVEIYPPSLRGAGLHAALGDLLAPLEARGIATELEVDEGVSLDGEEEALAFRVAQEAIRNSLQHGAPSTVSVGLHEDAGWVRLVVADDGRGFEPGRAAGEGHFGTSLMRDLAGEAGAELVIDSAPGAGTLVRLGLRPR
jgi:two-component system NarL family sensor kinase